MFDNIRMVMVNTSHPGNIGGAARAIKNMGMSRLVLIDPKDYPSEQAVSRAASALDVLDKIQIYDDLDEAIADCSLVIGTSARGRRIPWPLLTPRECGDRVWAESKMHQVAILYGREDRGLTNEELQKCHYHVHIPASPDYSSLNITCALQVIAYEIRMSALNEANAGPLHFDDWDIPPAKQSDMELYYAHLQETLEKLSFIDADNPRQALNRLRRLYNRIRPDQMELGMLRGMLTAIQNYVYHADKREMGLREQISQLEAAINLEKKGKV